MPARPSATVCRAESGSAEVAATRTRRGRRTSSSHSCRDIGSSVAVRGVGRLGMATSRPKRYAGTRRDTPKTEDYLRLYDAAPAVVQAVVALDRLAHQPGDLVQRGRLDRVAPDRLQRVLP